MRPLCLWAHECIHRQTRTCPASDFQNLAKPFFLDPLPPLGFSTPKKDDDDPASALPLSPPYFAFSPLPSSPFSSIANQSLSVFVFFLPPFVFPLFVSRLCLTFQVIELKRETQNINQQRKKKEKKRKNHKRNPKENASRVAGALIIPHLPRQEQEQRSSGNQLPSCSRTAPLTNPFGQTNTKRIFFPEVCSSDISQLFSFNVRGEQHARLRRWREQPSSGRNIVCSLCRLSVT